MKRFAALHDCPVLSSRASTAASTTSSRFSVARRMNGSEPPISRTTFFRLRPATSATAEPARSDPVTETPRTRGSGITFSAICSLVARIVWYAPSARPASSYIAWIASPDSGHWGAGFSRIGLPTIRFGPAKRATW